MSASVPLAGAGVLLVGRRMIVNEVDADAAAVVEMGINDIVSNQDFVNNPKVLCFFRHHPIIPVANIMHLLVILSAVLCNYLI